MPSIEDKKAERANKQVIFVGIIIILTCTGFLIWKFFFDKDEYRAVPMPQIRNAPNVDFDYLHSEEFKHFRKYETITINIIDERDLGRDNPFLPY